MSPPARPIAVCRVQALQPETQRRGAKPRLAATAQRPEAVPDESGDPPDSAGRTEERPPDDVGTAEFTGLSPSVEIGRPWVARRAFSGAQTARHRRRRL